MVVFLTVAIIWIALGLYGMGLTSAGCREIDRIIPVHQYRSILMFILATPAFFYALLFLGMKDDVEMFPHGIKWNRCKKWW